MEDRNTETKDIEQGMVMAADVTDIRLTQAGYYWDAGYNEFDFSCKINREMDILHMVQQRHDDGYGLVIRAEKNVFHAILIRVKIKIFYQENKVLTKFCAAG